MMKSSVQGQHLVFCYYRILGGTRGKATHKQRMGGEEKEKVDVSYDTPYIAVCILPSAVLSAGIESHHPSRRAGLFDRVV